MHWNFCMRSLMAKLIVSITIFLVTTLFTTQVFAQTVVRGPYLQQATDARMVVKWRTSTPTNSVVRYGFNPSNLIFSQVVNGSTTEHEVLLTSLTASTKYYYSVGSSTAILAGDDTYHFRTSPVPGASELSRFWVLGDSGDPGPPVINVREAYKNRFVGDDRANMVIMLGDNAYEDGTDSEYQIGMFNVFPEILRQAPVWSTIGNHDVDQTLTAFQSDPYYSIFSLPTLGESGGVPSGTEAYYSYDYGNVHFVVLDSYNTDPSPNGAMLSWLRNDLAANDKEWLIAFWHHPPYSKGSHDSDVERALIDMRELALPILENYGLDLVLSGHSHSYERSFLIDSHYGDSDSFSASNLVDGGDGRLTGDGAYLKPDSVAEPNAGAVYVVAGSSSRLINRSLDHEAMYISLVQFGSVIIDVNGNEMYVEFLNDSGQATDSFTILKGEIVDETGPVLLSARAVNPNLIELQFNEELDATSASNLSNYQINLDTNIQFASLSDNGEVVSLVVDGLDPDVVYTLTAQNIEDLVGNIINLNSQVEFTLNRVETREYRTGAFPNTAYQGTADSYLSSAQATTNFGDDSSLLLDGDDSGADLVSLLRWDISDIPVEATVSSVSISLGVFNPSNDDYAVFEVLRDWQENSVSWNSTGTTNWGSGGAQGNVDSANPVLGVVSPTSTGEYVLNLNAAGVEVVQGWIDGSRPNHGLLISSLVSSDGVDIHSSEATAIANRPALSITFENDFANSNQAPIVSAGADQTLTLDVTGTLAGLVFDDGLPNPPSTLVITWSLLSGPGDVVFSNPNALNSTTRFTEAGTYILRLTANDGSISRSDDVIYIVEESAFEIRASRIAGALAAINLLLLSE